MATEAAGESSTIWNAHEEQRRAFDRAWRRGGRPEIDAFLPSTEADRAGVLVELIRTDLEYRLKAGEPARVEDYRQRFPSLGEAALVELVRDEWELRRRIEPELSLEEYRRRFPEIRDLILPEWAGDPRAKLRVLPTMMGKYFLIEELGRGSFGLVYRAIDTVLHRVVALKVPRADALTNADEIERFLGEARCAAALKHPHIVAIHEFDRIEGSCYIASELVEGTTMAEHLRAGRLEVGAAVKLVAELADAVHEAHRHGVLHRDIKPANVLVDAGGAPHLTDFGLAKRPAADPTRTKVGELKGTIAYMAPEQARGDVTQIDARSDLYSLGVILYEVLAGCLPYAGTTESTMLRGVLDEEVRFPRKIDRSIPRDLETICLKCLEKEPARRYADVGALADDLRRFLAFQPIRARRIGSIGRIGRWCRRRPAVAALCAALAVVSAASAAVYARQHANASAALTHLADAEARTRSTEAEYLRSLLGSVADLERDIRGYELDIDSAHVMTARLSDGLRVKIERLQRVLEKLSPGSRFRVPLVRAYHVLGSGHGLMGRLRDARAEFARAFRAVSLAQPIQAHDRELARELASSHNDLANLLRRAQVWEEAETHYREALVLRGDQARQPPTEPAARAELAESLNDFALWLRTRGQASAVRAASQNDAALREQARELLKESRARFRRALDLRQDLLTSMPEEPKYKRDLAATWMNLGWLYKATKAPEEAQLATQSALKLYTDLWNAFPSSVNLAVERATCLHNLCLIERDSLHHVGEALRVAQDEAAVLQSLLEDHAGVAEIHARLALAFYDVATSREAQPRDTDRELVEALLEIDQAICQAPTIEEYPYYRQNFRRERKQMQKRQGSAAAEPGGARAGNALERLRPAT